MNEQLDSLIKELAEAVYIVGQTELPNAWNSLTLDVRYDDNGGYWSKLRADKLGDPAASVRFDDKIDVVLDSLDECRDAFGTRWYGLLLTVSSSKSCSVDFSYDQDYTTFFDS